MSKKNKSVYSTAIKLNSQNIRKEFFRFIFIDIFIIGLSLISIFSYAEKNFHGDAGATAERSFNFVSFQNATYNVSWPDGEVLAYDVSSVVYILRNIVVIIIMLQLLYILWDIVFGTLRIRKTLKPFNDLAEKAEELTNLTLFEDAISKISPESSKEHLNLGDEELKGLEDSINNLLDRMRDSYRQQARFVSDASHELRTPISVIQGYANMLDRWGKKDEEILEESIAAIKSESENMKNLVEQLLFLARGINGKTQLNIGKFSLKNLIEEVYEESKMIDENHIYLLGNTEECEVLGDISLIKQSARILVENSSKYTKDGGTITLSCGKSLKGECYFSIEDNGVGIGKEQVPQIFERFFRADTSRVRKDGGTGLGLSIAKWIIDNHGGYFGVLSREKIGTRITVFLK